MPYRFCFNNRLILFNFYPAVSGVLFKSSITDAQFSFIISLHCILISLFPVISPWRQSTLRWCNGWLQRKALISPTATTLKLLLKLSPKLSSGKELNGYTAKTFPLGSCYRRKKRWAFTNHILKTVGTRQFVLFFSFSDLFHMVWHFRCQQEKLFSSIGTIHMGLLSMKRRWKTLNEWTMRLESHLWRRS